MLTGLLFMAAGIVVLLYPHLLVVLLAAFLMLVGLGIMATSWPACLPLAGAGRQFRRLRRSSGSRFVNWIIRS